MERRENKKRRRRVLSKRSDLFIIECHDQILKIKISKEIIAQRPNDGPIIAWSHDHMLSLSWSTLRCKGHRKDGHLTISRASDRPTVDAVVACAPYLIALRPPPPFARRTHASRLKRAVGTSGLQEAGTFENSRLDEAGLRRARNIFLVLPQSLFPFFKQRVSGT